MSGWRTEEYGSPAARRNRVVSAALRAAYAWTVRARYPDAMREIARMTGVVMEAHGNGPEGPVTPLQLVAMLHKPLHALLEIKASDRTLAAPDESYSAIGEVILLDERSALTADAFELAAEYVVPLGGGDGAAWLPTWTRMHSDRIREDAFRVMSGSGDQDTYVTSRRFLIEHPAGTAAELGKLVADTGPRLPANGYRPISDDQVHITPTGGKWWWACPDCRWPMIVSGRKVRCRYRPHSCVYEIREEALGAELELRQIDEGPVRKSPKARSATNASCVDSGIWRFVVVPGSTELRLYEKLRDLGATVELWPDLDACDLRVVLGDAELRLDVKEYRSAHALAARLRAEPTRGAILLPQFLDHQREIIEKTPGVRVVTEKEVVAKVRRAVEGRGHSS